MEFSIFLWYDDVKEGVVVKEKIKTILNEKGAHLKRVDFYILLVLILIYSLVAFHQLGSMKNPNTYFTMHLDTLEESQINIALNEAVSVSKMRFFIGPETGGEEQTVVYSLYGSTDNENYLFLGTIVEEDIRVFAWQDLDLNQKIKYLRIEGNVEGSTLAEIMLYDQNGNPLKMEALDDASRVVIDESDTVPQEISYMNSTYFDEIYFARTAYEYANHLPAYEWVHPPLGKVIQMIPILFFGMNPFSYRLMGVIAGILLIPVLYTFALSLFKKRKYALTASLLLMMDNFLLAQSRMGTTDTFLVLFILLSFLFMYQYISLSKEDSLTKRLRKLFFSGLFIGCAITTKWTGLFAGLALAILFFTDLVVKNFGKGKKWTKDTTIIFLACFVFFIGIPLLIYVGMYFLFPNFLLVAPNGIHSITDLIEENQMMYQYHANLTDTHPFTSPWYSWPLLYKPVWYHVAYFANNIKETIAGIGNPLIWWSGALSLIFTLIAFFKTRKKEYGVIIIAFLCMWLPYLFIGRVMFLYHFFPNLPFLILSLVGLIKYSNEKFHFTKGIGLYLILCFIVFLLFYPVSTGMKVSANYVDFIRFLPSWYF